MRAPNLTQRAEVPNFVGAKVADVLVVFLRSASLLIEHYKSKFAPISSLHPNMGIINIPDVSRRTKIGFMAIVFSIPIGLYIGIFARDFADRKQVRLVKIYLLVSF
jgi:ABC-type phosphate transport system permease subunit